MRHIVLTLLLTAPLAVPLAAQRMFLVDSSRAVFDIDVATGLRTQVGTMTSNVGIPAGFAYDAASGTLYVTSSNNDSLYVVDITNWSATLVGAYGSSALVMHGLEWDPTTSTLFGMSFGSLYTIDTTTGAATLVGNTGLTGFCNLAWDPVQNVMWMSHAAPSTSTVSDALYTLDRTTAVATLVGPLGAPTNPNSLAHNIDDLTLYLVCNITTRLYSVDTTTGAATAIGASFGGNPLGLVWIPGSGRLQRITHACGQTTITVTAHPAIGSTVTTTIGAVTSLPFVGYGLTPLGVPFCGTCIVGHEWAAAVLGPTSSFPMPANPAFVGLQLFLQGADFLAPGGCPAPLLTVTDTIVVTFGT
jgi:DNA-binding beta-propeller fold protein YncE